MPAGFDSTNCWFNLEAAQGEINSVPFALSSSEPTNSIIGPEAAETTASSSVSASETEGPATSTTKTATSTTPSNEPQISPDQEEKEEEEEDQERDEELEDQEPKVLSTGAKVGIAAGISVGVIGTAVLITILTNLRKRRSANSTKRISSHQDSIHMIQGHQMAVHPRAIPPGTESNLAYWCQGSKTQYTLENQATPRYELP